MPISQPSLLDLLRALGEETRLRVAALLQHGELSVSDIADVLGQSQPRVSRHLRLLTEAGVTQKHREGTFGFFSLITDGVVGAIAAELLDRLDPHDPVLAADLDRLLVVRSARAAQAQQYFADVAQEWDHARSLHVPEAEVEATIMRLVGNRHRTVLDVGTGSGRMLQLLAPHSELAVGLDTSHSMLAVARANLERAELRRTILRQGDIYNVSLEHAPFDLVVVHQVLHYLYDPPRAVAAAARFVAPGGRLLIVDFAPHSFEFLREDHAHRRLGFRADEVADWMRAAGLAVDSVESLDPGDDGGARLTVSIWLGSAPGPDTQPSDGTTAAKQASS